MNEYLLDCKRERNEKGEEKKTKPVANQHLFYEGKHFSIIFVFINILNLKTSLRSTILCTKAKRHK